MIDVVLYFGVIAALLNNIWLAHKIFAIRDESLLRDLRLRRWIVWNRDRLNQVTKPPLPEIKDDFTEE